MHYLLFDGNSIGHRAQNTTPLTVGTMQTQAIYGFLRTVRSFMEKYASMRPVPVILWDGLSWRKQVFPGYRAAREKRDTKHGLERARQAAEYQRQRPHIEKAMVLLGVAQVRADNMEADDLAAILADLYASKGHSVTLVTEDRDWLQLVGERVTVERPIAGERVTLANFEEMTGCPSPRQFVQMKALMGDSSDDIPGVGGVGKKRAEEFVRTYGSFTDFLNAVLIERSIEIDKLPKWTADLARDEEKAIAFEGNMRLMDLRTTARPRPENMAVNKGKPDAEQFRRFCEILLFKSILNSFETWIEPFPVAARERVAA